MELKPLTIDDLPIFQKYYEMSEYDGYNSNFVTMFMWDHEYHVHYYADEHFLVSLCHYEHLLFWNMPLTCHEHFKEAIDFMRDYSQTHEIPFFMDGVLNEQCEWLEALYPNELIIHKQRSEYDYIYDRESLQNLTGKKMQKRRNHYNAFTKTYENRWKYRSLEKKDHQKVLELLDLWTQNKEDDINITTEKYGIIALLNHRDQLPLKMGCIEIDGNIEAFIIVSMLNNSTLQIHVEKANVAYRGLYVAILKSFLDNENIDAKWINREDDMDLENLRQSKLRLHPSILLEKSFIYPNKVVYRPSTANDYSQLVNAWKINFKEDSEAYIHDYFKTYYKEENTWVCEVENFIIGIVHLRPVEIFNHGTIEKASYIEGVSTHFMFRKQGYMKQLMHKALSETKCDYFLLQAYDWQIYDSFGFEDYTYKLKVEINEPFEVSDTYCITSQLEPHQALQLYHQMMQYKNGYSVRSLEYYEHLIDTMKIEGQFYLGNESSYIIYQMINDRCVILEAIYTNQKDLYVLLNHLLKTYPKLICLLEEDFKTDLNFERILFLKAKKANKEVPDTNIYFNEYI